MKSIPDLLRFTLLMLVSLPVFSMGAEEKPAEPSLRDRIYHFEHRLLPRWTHGTQGAFFSDLSKGTADQLKKVAAEIVGKDFAQKLVVRPLVDSTQVLIIFQEPTETALCFYAIVQKKGDKYRYLTLELTEDLFGNGNKTVFGEWDEAGGHKNLGTRKYSDAESFVAEATANAGKG